MRRKRVHLWALGDLEQLRCLGVIGASFLVGSGAGCWCSAFLGQEGEGALRSWLDAYLSLTRSNVGKADWLGQLWGTLRLPMLLSLLGFTVLGMILVPLVMGIRGFLLSFAVTGFVRTYAWRGLGAALLLFGPAGAVELPAIFLLACAAYFRSDALGREGRGEKSGPPLAVSILSWVLLVLSAVGQGLACGPLTRGLAMILG